MYDASRLEDRVQRGSIRGSDLLEDAAPADAAEPENDAAVSCGNGRIDEGERCDIGIQRGKAGACPDGCSGGTACTRRVLDGFACEARCVERELDDVVSGDGCCPEGADYHEDDDCSPRCGNGHVEPGETCDPASTCPSESACKKTDACTTARYLGAASSCDARCERTPITSCMSGDGCCPAGCDRARDGDCAVTCQGSACPGEGTPTPVPKPPAPEPEPEPEPTPIFECSEEHAGTRCRTCSCQHCGTQLAACLGDEPVDAALCNGAIACSERTRCQGEVCYCGNISADGCATMPQGECKVAWEEAARSTMPRVVQLFASTAGFTLAKAIAVIECRAQNCATECGL